MSGNSIINNIGLGKFALAKDGEILSIKGIGSCIGLVLYDKKIKAAGMAHIVLPCSDSYKNVNGLNKFKFADTAAGALLDELKSLGASLKNIKAKAAGGACILHKTGEKNIYYVKKSLEELNIQLLSCDVGGNYGRTISFNTNDFYFYISSFGKPLKKI